MSLFGLLLKKELRGFKGYKRNVAGAIVSAVTIIAVMAAFVYLFIALNGRFVTLGVSSEVLALFTLAIFVFSVVISLNKAAVVMYSASDAEIIRPLPLNPYIVVLSKMAALFVYELVAVGAMLLPILISFGVTGNAGAWLYVRAVFAVIFLALAVTAITTLIAPLYVKVKAFLLNHGLLFLIISLLFVFGLFFCYKYVLDLIIGLIRDKLLQYIFNSSTVAQIKSISGVFLFSSSLAMFVGGSNYWRVAVAVIVAALVLAGSFMLSAKLYHNVGKTYTPHAKKGNNKPHSVTVALILKEINELVRTPGYMFSYLSIALSLPVLTYLTMGVLQEVVTQLLTDSFIAPFALMILLLYSTVSNTFAGDAVSREGTKLSIVKTIPVSFKLQVGIKLLLALAIAGIAILVTVIVLVCLGTVTLLDGVMIFIITGLSTAASIISMLNSDLAGVDSERNTALSVVKSFLYSIVVGGIACVFAIDPNIFGGELFIYVLPLVLSVLYFAMAAVRYFKDMERRISLL